MQHQETLTGHNLQKQKKCNIWRSDPDRNVTVTISPYEAMQVREYRPVLLCKHMFFRYVPPEAMICNLLKLLTSTVL